MNHFLFSLTVFTLFFSPMKTNGQLSSGKSIEALPLVMPGKNEIKCTPFRMTDPINPGIDVSYERHYLEKFSTHLSYSYMVDILKLSPHEGRINTEDDMFQPRHPNFYYMAENEGEYFTFNMPLNFRIGFVF